MDKSIDLPLSVVMPVYNAGLFLSESIESILNQTFGDFEFIIINDGSKDNSLVIINYYSSIDPRIKIISRENRGLVASLNEGVLAAKGQFIARMDADDISRTDRFQIQLDAIQKKSLDLVGSNIEFIGAVSRLKEVHYPIEDQDIKFRMLLGSGFAHPTIMARSEVLKKNLYLLPEDSDFVGHSEDYELWTRLAIKGYKLGNLPVALLYYRISDQQYTQQYVEKQQLSTRNIAANYGLVKYNIPKEALLYYGFGSRTLNPQRSLEDFVFFLISLADTNGVSSNWLKTTINEIAIRMPESPKYSINLLIKLYFKERSLVDKRLFVSLVFKILPRVKNDIVRSGMAKVARRLGFRI